MWRACLIAGAVAGLVLAAGCGGEAAPAPAERPPAPTASPAPAPARAGCAPAAEPRRLVTVPDGAKKLPATVVGAGRAAAVTVNGTGGDGCQWAELAATLAREGFRVLMFEEGEGDEPADARAGARWLRAHGAREIAVLGTSLGGATAIVAATRLKPRFAALLTLSAVADREAPAGDPLAAARRLALPTMHVGTRDDAETYFGEDTRRIARATAASPAEIALVPGDEHGVDILAGERGADVTRRIVRFLRAAIAR
jgi:pimeloyl-ACP methyl ester carboxylesterase